MKEESMKLIDVFKAREPLLRLTEKRFNNYKVLRQLVKARKAVTAEVEFYAEAEKKANDLKASALTPLIIQQMYIEKWDGKLPQYGEVPRLFKDISKN